MTPKPVVPMQTINEFGEVNPADVVVGDSPDALYTPGWSEMRVKRDIEMGQYVRGERELKDVRQLPGKVRLMRRTKVHSQDPDATKTVAMGQKGYRYLTKEDIGKPYFTELPPGAHVLADGTVAKGDLVYVFADQRTAARNLAQNQRKIAEQLGASEAWESSVAQTKGTKPTTTTEKQPTIRVQS